MRVLLFSKSALNRRYGAAKLLIELARSFEARGIDVDLVGPDTLGVVENELAEATEAYLAAEGRHYDVAEVDYKFLRADSVELLRAKWGRQGPALVARIQLWRGHLLRRPGPPPLPSLRARVGRALRGPERRRHLKAAVAEDIRLFTHVDRIVVSNQDDRSDLTARGVDLERISVVTPGFDAESARALAAVADALPRAPPVVAFVGTFDERKGGGDFPKIFRRLAERVPGVRLLLVGTRGAVQGIDEVRAAFPRRLRDRLEIVPSYTPARLPELLAGCSVGVFPSYAEGFGYGVLEMLTAGLPVVAYDRPGPPVMLGPDSLVPVGQPIALADVVAELLLDAGKLTAARSSAAARAAEFTGWDRAADATLTAYHAALSTVA